MENLSAESKRIAFFDSGIGGLNLLSECYRQIKGAEFYYFADNFNMPYGSLSERELSAKVEKIFEDIADLSPDAAVIACNTVTARCAGFLREKYKFPIVGVQPAIKPAAAVGECVVLATPLTASSSTLNALVSAYGLNRTRVVSCASLAEYIERNIFSIDNEKLFSLLPDIETENLVLGCTHYSFVKSRLQKFYNCRIFDGIEGTVRQILKILGKNDHLNIFLQKEQYKERNFVYFHGGDEEKNRKVFNSLIKM